jgi:hypothetical protein
VRRLAPVATHRSATLNSEDARLRYSVLGDWVGAYEKPCIPELKFHLHALSDSDRQLLYLTFQIWHVNHPD